MTLPPRSVACALGGKDHARGGAIVVRGTAAAISIALRYRAPTEVLRKAPMLDGRGGPAEPVAYVPDCHRFGGGVMTTPSLLQLATGRRHRLRHAPKVRPKEIDLHIAEILRRFAHPDWLWGHYPAGELRDIRTAAKLRAMGTQRGWPEFLLFGPTGQLHGLELKRQGEGLSDAQEVFSEWCAASGVPHGVSRTLDEAIRFLREWGALRVGIG